MQAPHNTLSRRAPARRRPGRHRGLAPLARLRQRPPAGRRSAASSWSAAASAAPPRRATCGCGRNVDVTLVERNASFVSCPITNLVLGGHKQMADITRGYDGPARRSASRSCRARWWRSTPHGKKVRLADGSELPYDRLVLSPGVDFMTDGVAGLTPRGRGTRAARLEGRAADRGAAPPARGDARRRRLRAERSRRRPTAARPGPTSAPAWWPATSSSTSRARKVLVLDANPEITVEEGAVRARLQGPVQGHHRVPAQQRAEGGRRRDDTAKLEFDDVKADVLNVVPPHRGGDIARSAGLLNMNDRWVGVNWLTMESTAVPGIHVLGDATLLGAGDAQVAATWRTSTPRWRRRRSSSCCKGEPVNPAPVMMNTCYSFVTATDVIHVASVHQYDNADKTLQGGAGLGRRVVGAERDRRALRAVVGAEHLERHAGELTPAAHHGARPGLPCTPTSFGVLMRRGLTRPPCCLSQARPRSHTGLVFGARAPPRPPAPSRPPCRSCRPRSACRPGAGRRCARPSPRRASHRVGRARRRAPCRRPAGSTGRG